MNRLAARIMCYLTLASSAICGRADTVTSQHYSFGGINVYSPTLIFDGGVYKMWYGGWQDKNDGHDRIYYRTSPDGLNWTAPVTVLNPTDVVADAVHVNDPSVTKHYNSISKQYQYTMFYSVCRGPCISSSQNQTWSSVSSDGIHWIFHQPLMTSLDGSSEPSAIIDQQPDGTFWKIYYMNTAGANTQVFMAAVSGNRTVISQKVVYTTPRTLANPEVRNVGGRWILFLNVYRTGGGDIYKIESNSNLSWSGDLQPLILNNGPNICATIAPGVLPLDSKRYALYFGQTPSNPGCQVDRQTSIQGWIWQRSDGSTSKPLSSHP